MYEIRIKVNREEELYDPFDPDMEVLSSDAADYIIKRFEEKAKIGDEPVIKVISSNPLNKERVKSAFTLFIDGKISVLEKEQKRTIIKQIGLFLIGIAFIALWLILASSIKNIAAEVLSIIGSFAVWEAANIWIVEAPKLRLEKRLLKRLKDTKVEFEYIKE